MELIRTRTHSSSSISRMKNRTRLAGCCSMSTGTRTYFKFETLYGIWRVENTRSRSKNMSYLCVKSEVCVAAGRARGGLDDDTLRVGCPGWYLVYLYFEHTAVRRHIDTARKGKKGVDMTLDTWYATKYSSEYIHTAVSIFVFLYT